SVLLRVTCIFTGVSVSPSPCSRQQLSRYAIRAGRNLPDKEFRYLRTVIVTAAVYRGFNSRLAPILLTFRHRAGVSPYTSAFALAQSGFGSKSLHPAGLPLFLSYGEILPSSLSMVLSIALESSSHLPASVCGTVTCVLARGFSWKLGISHFAFLRRLLFASQR